MLTTEKDARLTGEPARYPPTKIQVRLDEYETLWVSLIGSMRETSNRFRGASRKSGQSEAAGYGSHIEGCFGEYTVAKGFGWFWNGSLGDYAAADVRSIEVRHTIYDGGRLRVNLDDDDDARFVLVTGTAPLLTIRGWLWGWEAKRKRWWCDPQKGRFAFFVPQEFLRPLRRGAPGEVLWD